MSDHSRYKELQAQILQIQSQLADYTSQLSSASLSGTTRQALQHLQADAEEQLETFQDELTELAPRFGASLLLTLRADNFKSEVLESQLPVLVDCWAEWCGPCKPLTAMIEGLAHEYKQQIKFCKLNVDEVTTIASRLDVQTLPTVLLWQKGKLVERMMGMLTYQQLQPRLEALLVTT